MPFALQPNRKFNCIEDRVYEYLPNNRQPVEIEGKDFIFKDDKVKQNKSFDFKKPSSESDVWYQK